MFERFTDRARRVVVLAQEEARMLNHNYIGTEHILLGLIHEGEGVAAKSLESLDIKLEQVRSQVEEIIGPGQQAPSGHIPFTPRAKKVLELSLREALQLGHNYIGTEHILLGLIREGEGVAAQVLVKLGADLNRVRQQVIQLLSGYQGKEPAQAGPAEGTPSTSLVLDQFDPNRKAEAKFIEEDVDIQSAKNDDWKHEASNVNQVIDPYDDIDECAEDGDEVDGGAFGLVLDIGSIMKDNAQQKNLYGANKSNKFDPYVKNGIHNDMEAEAQSNVNNDSEGNARVPNVRVSNGWVDTTRNSANFELSASGTFKVDKYTIRRFIFL